MRSTAGRTSRCVEPHRSGPARAGVTVLWEHVEGTTRYSVRSHGASVRLYSNGVFHSQWNPDRPFAGGVWDCLSLPVLYRDPAQIARVALLGVGGGAVLRQLSHLLPEAGCLGVEIDPVHVRIATQWFGVDALQVRQDDAIGWLETREDAAFDVIVDDLFGHEHGEPVRAAALEFGWVDTLVRTLDRQGVLIVNAVTSRELKRAAPVFADAGLRHGSRWTLPGYENAIGVLSREPLHSRDWSRRLESAALSAADRRQARCCRVQPLRGL